MRWNCPHCEELVTAGIDFENTSKAYVRCAKCGGLALIHRSAAHADSAAPLTDSLKNRLAYDTAKTSTERSLSVPTPPPPNAYMTRSSSFHASFDLMEEIPMIADAPADDGVRTLAMNPPSFLLKEVHGVERAFPTEPEVYEIEGDTQEIEIKTEPKQTNQTNSNRNSNSIRPTLALIAAALIALGSGAYLYSEGKRALSPSVPSTPFEADAIHSKANSAIRIQPKIQNESLAIVRVSHAVLREGPSLETTALQTLERSTTVKVIEEKSGWVRVNHPKISAKNQTAWIRSDLVTRVPN